MRGLSVPIIILFLFLPSLAFGLDPSSESFLLYFDTFQEISLSVNAENLNNNLQESNTSRTTSVIDSFKDNEGIFNLNQASGSLNNQSNIVIILFTPGKSLLEIQVDNLGESTGNTVKYSGMINRQSLIENSFDNYKGVFMVNQSPGNLNQQSNTLILSMGSALKLSDSELAIKTGGNLIEYDPNTNVEKKDILKNSFSGTTGIGIISQSSGDLNTIRNNVGISFSRETITLK